MLAGLVAVVGLAVGHDPAPDDLGALQGYWKPLSIKYESKDQMAATDLQKVTVVFDQSEYHLYFKEAAKEPIRLALANIAVNPAASPKGIEFTFAAGPLRGQKCHGIYEVAGNQLKLCYGPADRPRPGRFEAPPQSGYFLEVWAKQPTK